MEAVRHKAVRLWSVSPTARPIWVTFNYSTACNQISRVNAPIERNVVLSVSLSFPPQAVSKLRKVIGHFVTLIWGRQRAVMLSRVFLETSHSISFSFPRFTQATQVTSPFYLFVLFAFVKWILNKRWILRCVILKARPNGSNIIQHCWTTLHSVERVEVAKRISTLGIERSGYKIYPQSIENNGAPYWFAKMARNRPTVKIYLAATALLEMSENENDKVTKRGKARQHWIKRRDEKGYFTNIVRGLMIEGTTAYREMMRRSSDFMTSIGSRFV